MPWIWSNYSLPPPLQILNHVNSMSKLVTRTINLRLLALHTATKTKNIQQSTTYMKSVTNMSICTHLSKPTFHHLHSLHHTLTSYLAAQWLHVVILYFPIHWLQHNHPILQVHHHFRYIAVGSLKTFQWTHVLLGIHSCNCKKNWHLLGHPNPTSASVLHQFEKKINGAMDQTSSERT